MSLPRSTRSGSFAGSHHLSPITHHAFEQKMKPEILALVPIYAPTLAELEREFTVHRLWAAQDPDWLMREVADRVTVVVTTGLAGYHRRHVEALPKLKL